MSGEHGAPVDVIIAGGGPVGLSAANLLGLYGCSVTVLEAADQLFGFPRAIGLDDESFRAMQGMGLAEQVRPLAIQGQLRFVDRRGKLIAESVGVGQPLGWPRRNTFNQAMVDTALYEGLDRYDRVNVVMGNRFTGLEQDADGVTVTTLTSQGETRTYRGSYLIGADGGSSAVRKSLGISFDGSSNAFWLVIDAEDDPMGIPLNYIGANPRRPYGVMSLPFSMRRFEFALRKNETEEMALKDEFIFDLLSPFVEHPERVKILRKRVYRHGSRMAHNFRQGRVFLAGDAAHIMTTFAGQGWNSGMRDATNISWKLASVIKGQASEEILDTYHLERWPHAKAMVDLSLALARIFSTQSMVMAGLRDALFTVLKLVPSARRYVMEMRYKPMPRYDHGVVVDASTAQAGLSSAELTGPTFAFRTAKDKPSPVGTIWPQPRVSTDQGIVMLDEVIGTWWSVVVWTQNPRRFFSSEAYKRLEALGARIVVAVPNTEREMLQAQYGDAIVVGDVDWSIRDWFAERPAGAVFVRPDRIVAAIATPESADRVVRALDQAAFVPNRVAETAGQSS